MPFPLRGFDTDNGGEFMNETVAAYCRAHGIPCTRSRPYHKNDQAWVEQKNGSVVRRLVGYRRLEGLAAAAALSRLYAASRLFVNFFQPSFKLASKTRVGAKVRKTYHAPETPYARLLALRGHHRRDEGSLASGGRCNSTRYGSWRRSEPCNTTWRHWPPARPPTWRRATRAASTAFSRAGHGVATRRGPRHPSPRAQTGA